VNIAAPVRRRSLLAAPLLLLLAPVALMGSGCAGDKTTRHVDAGKFDVTPGKSGDAPRPNMLARYPEQGEIEGKVIAALAKELATAQKDKTGPDKDKKNVHVHWKTQVVFGGARQNSDFASLYYDDAEKALFFEPHERQGTDVYASVTPEKISQLAALGPSARLGNLEQMGCEHHLMIPEPRRSRGPRLRFRLR